MSGNRVRKIVARQVLSEFDYEIDFGDPTAQSRLALIYAQNGRGKTNLLRGVNCLLNPTLDSIQSLIEIPIERLTVHFDGGGEVCASRENAFDGAYELRATLDGASEVVSVDPTDFAGRLYRRVWHERDEYRSYVNLCRGISYGAVFIGDDRLTSSPSDEGLAPPESVEGVRPGRGGPGSVARLLERVERMLTRQAVSGMSNQPQGGGVYSQLTASTLRGGRSKSNAAESRAYLEKTLRDLISRGLEYEKYGLMQLNQLRNIQQQLASARQNNKDLPTLRNVLTPYLDSISAQVKELRPALKLIDTYVGAVNAFLDRKQMKFTAFDGISLLGRDDTVLNPDSLSSGERHLIILLSHAILAVPNHPLVILDEPEISLGLDWQRMLLPKLLECSSSGNVQFLVASHSVQIMGTHDNISRPAEGGEG